MSKPVLPFSHLERSWREHNRLPDKELYDAAFTPLQLQLLHNRGIDEAQRHHFLDNAADMWRATPPLLAGIEQAVERIQQAIASNERIIVFGDYDCDGMTSCVLLTRALQLLGATVEPFIPTREDDGRGLNNEALHQLKQRGAQLLITTDCGTSNVEEVKLAAELGMEVIVTDHHPLHGASAVATAFINPQRPDDLSANKSLAGVGVAFRLAEQLAKRAGNDALHAELPNLLDLVAIGTIADVVPLTRENWVLVHAGLAMLNRSPRAGIAALAAHARLTRGQIVERDISFAIAPRLNAAGRLGTPEIAWRLLLTNDRYEAAQLAQQLDELNSERQRKTDEMLRAAREQIEQRSETTVPPVLIVRGTDWPLGILGLVAGRLADDYQRPAFVISSSVHESRGSARGRSDINLGTILAQWDGEFKRFGGHAQAAGFTLANDDLDLFISYLHLVFATPDLPSQPGETLSEQASDAGKEPILVDCELPLSSITADRYRAIRALAPFGAQFPEPVFIAKRLKILRCWQSGIEGRTLRLALGDKGSSRNFIWQRQGVLAAELQAALSTLPLVDVVYTLDGLARRDGFPELLPRIVTMTPAQD